MNLISQSRSVLSNPPMLAAYARWRAAKLFRRKSPRLRLPGGASIGGWLSFSEFWSFRDTIPESERRFVEHCLQGKALRGLAIDIGANIGTFTCFIAAMGHTVHAFEPIPETFVRLRNNVKHNGLLDRARLNCLAVGQEQTLAAFRIQENSPATNRLAVLGQGQSPDGASVQVVAVVTVDDYCARQNLDSIDFLKVDVEGMEPYVLQGARRLLTARKIAAILIEICPDNLHSVGLTPADLYREFEAVGYVPHLLGTDGRVGQKLPLNEIEAMKLANVALLPD